MRSTERTADPIVAAVHAAVAAHRPVDGREAGAQARILAAFDRLEAPLDEHADPVHVTASAIVTSQRGTVLHRHKRLGLWLQPGGHLRRGETPWEAVVRETAEETGLDATHPPSGPDLLHVDVHPGGRGHTHLDLRYLLHAPPADPRPRADESPDVRWFDWEEAGAVADPGLVGALRALAGRHAAPREPMTGQPRRPDPGHGRR
jgi:8-oxo-dGTP pyrophosphatase MutT (NUDIX family)